MKNYLLLIGVILIVLVSCQPQTVIANTQSKRPNVSIWNLDYGFWRMADYDAGIVCYTEKTMVCFDMDDTWLNKE